MAKDLKIDTSTIAKWESNTRQITLEWAIKLANYFNIDVGNFISVNQITSDSVTTNEEDYKKILKEKGLMDEKENNRYIIGKNDLYAVVIALKLLLNAEDYDKFHHKLFSRMMSIKSKIKTITFNELLLSMQFPENWHDISKKS